MIKLFFDRFSDARDGRATLDLRMELLDKRTASVVTTILLFAAAGAFVYAARRILVVFLFAIFFSYLLDPWISHLQGWTRLSRGSRSIAILEVYAILCIVVAILMVTAGPGIISEGRRLAHALPGLFENIGSGQIAQQIGSNRGWNYSTQVRLQQFLASHSDSILRWASAAGSWLAVFAENLIWLIVIPILAIFFLKDGRSFTEGILRMIERKRPRQFLSAITEDVNQMLAHYIRSQLLLAALSLVAYVIVLSVLGVPYGSVLGSLGGIMEFVPVLGPFVAALVILGVSFLANYHHLLWVAAFLGLWRCAQDYVISPRILGSKLRLHPLAVIFAVLVGGEIAGVIGIFISIPIAAGLRIIWKRWQREPAHIDIVGEVT